MDDLLKDAIADAKAVRETALANAKIALEEAFTPRLQSMLSKKIATEMEAEEEDDLAPEEGDDEFAPEEGEEIEDEDDDELDLESVLAELEADLKDAEEDDELEEIEDKDGEDKVEENDVSSEIGKADNKVADKANDSSSVGQGPESEGSDKPEGSEDENSTVVKEEKDEDEVEEDLDLDEVLKALSEEEDAEDDADKVEELKKEITETRNVVKFMRAKLNEVNLLNAKLLFSNKLFRAFGLNNNQKLKVVENFDRTKNLREVKLVYATLAESFKSPTKLSESVVKGSSSKPVASTKPAKAELLSEGSELKARFKKLANIL